MGKVFTAGSEKAEIEDCVQKLNEKSSKFMFFNLKMVLDMKIALFYCSEAIPGGEMSAKV